MDRESYRKITEIVKATVSPVPDENEDARYLEISVEVGTYESILNNLEEGGLMESEGDDVSVPRLRPIGLLPNAVGIVFEDLGYQKASEAQDYTA